MNDIDAAVFATSVADSIVGPDKASDKLPPVMGAEDFGFMLQKTPGAFVAIGNGPGPFLHHPEYNFNDDAIPYGAAFFVSLVESSMPA